MSMEAVKEYLKQFNKENEVIELKDSTATVELAAAALSVTPARIAKTLSFKIENSCILIVTAGDTKIDNKKFKAKFNCKARMPLAAEVVELTGHAIGGVCPFALPSNSIKVYCDTSMKRFETVYPACGSSNSAIKLTCDELFKCSQASEWVDICKDWENSVN